MIEVSVIDTYLQEKLKSLLVSYSVAPNFIEEVLASVGSQIASYLSHWDDVRFRNGLAIIGFEEGMFYKPYTEINPFIVVTVRNSLIERLNSCEHGSTGLSKPLTDENVKAITKQAIVYFKDIDFLALNEETKHLGQDFYGSIIEKYPIAWTALCELGNSDEQCITYEKAQGERLRPKYLSHPAGTASGSNEKLTKVVLDGISPIIDERLRTHLSNIYLEKLDIVYFDCFKMLSRNIDKLLKVMEFVLSNGKPFVTCNYYISNGRVLRRKSLQRPARDEIDMNKKLDVLNGTNGDHREALKSVAQAIRAQ